jgi:succinate dehydrogenase / fumarate reductase, cytochrome b subunit
MSRDRTFFLIRKLHSLTGIIPIGTFLCAHLFFNSAALYGECAFTDGVRSINSLPYLTYIEWGGIILPLCFHGLLGLYMIFIQSRYNNSAYNYARNWWYAFQRLTGVVVFAFLVWHLWDLMLAKLFGQMHLEEFYPHLAENMSAGRPYLALFIVGCLAASFHFGNGLWGFAASWGFIQSRKAQKKAGWVFATVGFVLFAAWFNIIFHFATGGRNAIPVQEHPVECVSAPTAHTTSVDASERPERARE